MADRGGHLAHHVAIALRHAADALHVLSDLQAGRGLLASGGGDVDDAAHQAVAAIQHGLHRLVGVFGDGDAVAHQLAALLHVADGVAGFLADGVDDAADLHRGLGGPAGQVAHLVRHHGETAAHLAGARGFDRRVQRQQIGLVRDVLDHVDDGADLG